MTEIDYLKTALRAFANLEEEDFILSLPHWQCKQYKKGDYFNAHKHICRHLGFVIERTESFLFKTPEERYLDLVKHQPDMANAIPLYHISSYLGIQGPSLSRIRKRISGK